MVTSTPKLCYTALACSSDATRPAMYNVRPVAAPLPPAAAAAAVCWWQVENVARQQYHTLLSLNDCLDLAVERSAIFFRKVEVRQTRGEDMVLLLSILEAMWQGQRKGSAAALKTSSSSTATATGTASKRRGKRKQGASNAAVGPDDRVWL